MADGLLVEWRSIYDLDETKKALTPEEQDEYQSIVKRIQIKSIIHT
jgi:DNA replication initiation complex subunit (GINS family)